MFKNQDWSSHSKKYLKDLSITSKMYLCWLHHTIESHTKNPKVQVQPFRVTPFSVQVAGIKGVSRSWRQGGGSPVMTLSLTRVPESDRSCALRWKSKSYSQHVRTKQNLGSVSSSQAFISLSLYHLLSFCFYL